MLLRLLENVDFYNKIAVYFYIILKLKINSPSNLHVQGAVYVISELRLFLILYFYYDFCGKYNILLNRRFLVFFNIRNIELAIFAIF